MVGEATSVSKICLLIPVFVSNFVLDARGSPFALEEETPAAVPTGEAASFCQWLGGQKGLCACGFCSLRNGVTWTKTGMWT